MVANYCRQFVDHATLPMSLFAFVRIARKLLGKRDQPNEPKHYSLHALVEHSIIHTYCLG